MSEKIDKFIKSSNDIAEERKSELRGRRSKELELWHQWNNNGRKSEDLHPLLKSLDPFVKKETNTRLQGLGGSIPQAALHNELRNTMVKAIQSYDPAKGTQLTTHVKTNFMRITDTVAKYRNERYMPRADVEHYQVFQNARNELEEELGREPTHQELQTKLPWTLKKIKKMTTGFGKEVYTDMGDEFESPHARMGARDAHQFIASQLSDEENAFAELHFPAEGGKPLGINAIAKQLKISPNRAYRIKAKIETKIKPILRGA
jgi:DNA-directed RNA polymerase specialized sigma subunit